MLKNALHKYGIKSTRVHLEITKPILHAILFTLDPIHDDINLYITFCMTFTAFLHIEEFTWTQWNTDSSLQFLSHDLIQFVTDDVLLQLLASKTDLFRKSVIISLFFSYDFIYLIIALCLLFHRYSKSFNEFLFSRLYDSFTRDWVLQWMS